MRHCSHELVRRKVEWTSPRHYKGEVRLYNEAGHVTPGA